LVGVKLKVGLGVNCYNLPPALLKKIKKDLTFDNPDYKSAMKQGRYIPASLTSHITLFEMEKNEAWVPRGYIYFLQRWLRENKYKVKVKDNTLRLKKLKLEFLGELRPYQITAVKDAASYPVSVIEASTGSGKTIIAIFLIVKRQQPTLIIVHSKELLYQWQDQILKFTGEQCGLIGNGKFKIKPITVGIINTVNKRVDDLINHFGHIIIDECHKIGSKTYTDTLQNFPAKHYLGLSATMYRRDGLGHTIFACIGPKKHTVDKKMLFKTGAVLIPDIYRIETNFNYMFTNDYSTMIKYLTQDHERNTLICNEIRANFKKYNAPILIVSDRKKHCETMQKMLLNTYNIKSTVLTGNVKNSERMKIIDEVKSGKCKVLFATISLIGEGFDAPDLTALFLTTPVKYSGRVLQACGRILRPKKNKVPRIYDFRDNNVNVLRYSGFGRDRLYKKEWG